MTTLLMAILNAIHVSSYTSMLAEKRIKEEGEAWSNWKKEKLGVGRRRRRRATTVKRKKRVNFDCFMVCLLNKLLHIHCYTILQTVASSISCSMHVLS